MLTFFSFTLLSALSAHARPSEAAFQPIARAGGELVEVAQFKSGDRSYAVRCALTEETQLRCVLTNSRGRALSRSHVEVVRTNEAGALVTVVGVDGGVKVTQSVQLKEITRDIKEKLAYVAQDYDDELERAEIEPE